MQNSTQSNLVFIENSQVITDSLTVAQVFNKEHDKVMRDIEIQIAKLHEAGELDFSTANFGESTYTNSRGRTYQKINLSEDAFTLIAMSYTTPKAMKFKIKFIQEFKRMKEYIQQQQQPKMPTTYKEALIQLLDQVEANEKLLTNNLVLEQQVNELKPKASYYDLILQNKSLISVSHIAKDYGMGAPTLNRKLHELGVQYKQGQIWLLYAKYQDKGYTQTYMHAIDSENSKPHTKWTQKGRLFIYEILKRHGIVPMIERQYKEVQ